MQHEPEKPKVQQTTQDNQQPTRNQANLSSALSSSKRITPSKKNK
jgi:hypothetical protein